MTSDAEQSLPLQVVATLKCGEEVTVLANDEGYTVKVKNADGKIGYVAAAMYLKKIPAPKRPRARMEAPNPFTSSLRSSSWMRLARTEGRSSTRTQSSSPKT